MSDKPLNLITIIAIFIFLLAAGMFTGDLIKRNATQPQDSVYTTPRPSLTPLPLDQIEFDPFDPRDAIDPNATPAAYIEVIEAERKIYQGNGYTMQIPASFESRGLMTDYEDLKNVELFDTFIDTSYGKRGFTMFLENGAEVSETIIQNGTNYELGDEIDIILWNTSPSAVSKQKSTIEDKDQVLVNGKALSYYGTSCSDYNYTCYYYVAEFVANGRLQRILFKGNDNRGQRMVFESILETIVYE